MKSPQNSSHPPKPGIGSQDVVITPEQLSQNNLFSGINNSPVFKTKGTLVLEFDIHGNSSLREMRLNDVLCLIREACYEKDDQSNVSSKENKAKPSFTQHLHRKGSIFPGACDVQNVHMRDLRKLDAAFAVSNEPSIMVRKQAILINADPIRAVILRHTCLVFVPDGADSLLSQLMTKFREGCDENEQLPYEFRALEAILSTLCRTLSSDFERLLPPITTSLDRLANARMTSGELETLRSLKNTMSEFESQIDGLRRALVELLDNDEDLHLLHLTKLYETPSLIYDLSNFDAEDSEILLEAYLQDIHTIRTKVGLIQHRISNTESLVMLKLDSVRNTLLSADVIFGLISMCMSFGMFVTGSFGMNLRSGFEDAYGWFWTVVIVTLLLSICVIIGGICYFRRNGLILP